MDSYGTGHTPKSVTFVDDIVTDAKRRDLTINAIYYDIANKKIYTKQISMDGNVVLNMYELKPIPSAVNGDFITREEFEKAITSIREALINTEKTQQEVMPQKQQPKQEFNF